MPVDNEIFEREADGWWSDDSHLALLRCLVPPRVEHLKAAKGDLGGTTLLDVGCGGGLFAEALSAQGCEVAGVDVSQRSIRAARRHARGAGVDINYVVARAEELPFADASFDVVCCCDVLEHVDDVGQTVAESARVLKPGGLYLFDTINRTVSSWFFLIELFQEWKWTRLVPPGLHEHEKFVRPNEMKRILVENGLEPRDFVGLAPDMNPLRHFGRMVGLWKVKRGKMSFTEMGERMAFRRSRMMAMNYMGLACKNNAVEPREG